MISRTCLNLLVILSVFALLIPSVSATIEDYDVRFTFDSENQNANTFNDTTGTVVVTRTAGSWSEGTGLVKESLLYNSAYAGGWNPTTGATFTISTWINISDWNSPPGSHVISDHNTWRGFGITTSSKLITFSTEKDSPGTGYSTKANIGVGNNSKWVHIVGVKNNTNISIYVNGVHYNTTQNAAITNYPGNVGWGRRPGGTGSFTGGMDDTRYYSRALGMDEVQELFLARGNGEVFVRNTYDLSLLSDFNVTWTNTTGSFVNSSNITEQFAIYDGLTGVYNITVQKSTWYDRTYVDVNITQRTTLINLSRGTVEVQINTNAFNLTVYNTTNGIVFATNLTNSKNGIIFLNGSTYDNITVLVEKTGYVNASTTFINDFEDKFFNFSLYIDPSILNTTIYDETTGDLITSPVSLQIVGDSVQNYTNTTGVIYADGLLPGTYELIYSSEDFFQRRYYLNIPVDSFVNLKLYLLNSSNINAALITYEIQDENGVSLSNTTLKVLRNYPSENVYKIVEMSVSDSNGEGGIHLEKIDPKYKFIVESGGNVIFTSLGAQVFNDNLIIRADTSEDVILSLVTIQAMTDSLTFNNNTNNFVYTWNDPTSIVSEVCLTIEKISGLGITQINYSCVNSAAGSITLGIGENRTGQYSAIAQVETNTAFSPHISEVLQVILPNLGVNLGGLGLFMGLLLILGLALTGMFAFKSAAATGIMAAFGYIAAGFIGLIQVTIASVIAIIVILVLILVFGARVKGGDA